MNTNTQHDLTEGSVSTEDAVSETITIAGMSCGHCVGAVRRELEALDGVEVEGVAVGEARIRRDPTRADREAVEAAIEDAGFTPRG